MLGAFLYAYIIGDFSNLLANLSQERDRFDEKMRSINDLLGYIDAPSNVREKVQNYFDFKYANKEGASELIEELPASLQVELVKQRFGKLIDRVPFFAALNDKAVVDLCQQMTSFTVTPGDVIMEKGSWHDELLILSKGTAKTESSDEDGSVTRYDAGSFWGEMQVTCGSRASPHPRLSVVSCWPQFLGLEKQRTIGVVAASYCEIASLSPADILPGSQIHSRLTAYAEMRQEIDRKKAAGGDVDVEKMSAELQQRYRDEDGAEDEPQEGEGEREKRLRELRVFSDQELCEELLRRAKGGH